MSDPTPSPTGTTHRRRNRRRCRVPARPEGTPGQGDLTIGHGVVQLAVGVATAAAAAAVGSAHGSAPVLAVALAVTVACYGALCAVDLAEQRLPNLITVPLATAAALTCAVAGLVGATPGRSVAALATGAGFALVLWLLRFGMGDVKLAVTVGIVAGWLGPDAIRITALAGSASGALIAAAVLVVHRRRDVTFGFGPCLVIGSVAGMLLAG